MSKVYLVAINWQKVKHKDAYKGISILNVGVGTDIAYFVGLHPYEEGWRVYVFTTKKERDDLVEQTLKTPYYYEDIYREK